MTLLSFLAICSLHGPEPAWAAEAVPAGEIVSVEGVVFVRPDGRESAAQLKPAKAGDLVRAGDVVNTSSNGKIKLLLKDKSIVDLGPSALFKVDQFAANGGTDRQVDVSMMYGTMRTAVTQKLTGKGRFKVRTPTATMGVRGTEFVVKSEVKSLDEVRHVIKNPDKPLPTVANAAAGPTTAGKDGKAMGAPAPAPVAKTEITVIQGQVDVAKPETKSENRKPGSVEKEAPKVVSLTAGMQVSSSQANTKLEKPVTLDTKQLAAVASVAKVQDNTFQKAVQINVTDSKGDGSNAFAGAGDATRAILSQTLAVPVVIPVNISEMIPGATAQPTSSVPFNTNAGMRKLRVIIVTQ